MAADALLWLLERINFYALSTDTTANQLERGTPETASAADGTSRWNADDMDDADDADEGVRTPAAVHNHNLSCREHIVASAQCQQLSSLAPQQ